jgi:toxin ParE1/3/4
MSRFRVSRLAQSDLDEIWRYVAVRNLPAADDLIDEITAEFKTLTRFPRMGQGRDEFGKGLRSIPVGKYLVFYHKVKGGISIVRVLHGMRNLEEVFRPPS